MLPASHAYPAAHGPLQLLDTKPVALPNRPLGQRPEQLAEPIPAAPPYVPTGQLTHVVAPASEYLPTGHTLRTPPIQIDPAGHSTDCAMMSVALVTTLAAGAVYDPMATSEGPTAPAGQNTVTLPHAIGVTVASACEEKETEEASRAGNDSATRTAQDSTARGAPPPWRGGPLPRAFAQSFEYATSRKPVLRNGHHMP